MYKHFKNFDGQVVQDSIQRLSDNAFIPFNPSNTDYQNYLLWLNGYEIVSGELVKTSDGNTPLPADE